MFFKIAAILVVALGALSISATEYSCNTGPVQCCGSLHDAASYDATNILALVGVAVQDISAQIGLECSPISVIGAGTGANCGTSPVCCEHNLSNQLVGINCTPASVSV